MSLLTKLWEDKLNSRQARDFSDLKEYTVAWDHPDHPRGTKVTRESFRTLEEAREYAISIGLKYDLRKYNGVIPSLDPNLSRYKSGYTPMEDEATIPYVMPSIQMVGTMPQEISDREVYDYKTRHNIPTGEKGEHHFPGDTE